jgi:hypothetical protein
MTLEQRIAQIVALDCLTPAERAEMILAQPGLYLRRIRVAVCEAVAMRGSLADQGGNHGRSAA